MNRLSLAGPTLLLVLLALAGAACSGDGDPTGLEPTIATTTPESTAQPTVTAEPLPTPTVTPQATATPLPPTPPTATPTAMNTPEPTCPPRTHNHLDIDLLRQQPTMKGAVISEVDDGSVQIVLEGFTFVVQGRAKTISLVVPREASEALITRVWAAIGPIAFAC